MMVYSTAGWSFLVSHVVNLLLGFGAMYVTHKIKFKYFSMLGMLGYFVSLLLLVLVLVIGVSINGASRWLSIVGHQFQPSDIAKLALLLFMARQISKNRAELGDFKSLVWRFRGRRECRFYCERVWTGRDSNSHLPTMCRHATQGGIHFRLRHRSMSEANFAECTLLHSIFPLSG